MAAAFHHATAGLSFGIGFRFRAMAVQISAYFSGIRPAADIGGVTVHPATIIIPLGPDQNIRLAQNMAA